MSGRRYWPARSGWGCGRVFSCTAPALAAVWTVPWFVTQDGSAHVYNARILASSWDPGSPFRDVYMIQWRPIPRMHVDFAPLIGVTNQSPAAKIYLVIGFEF